MKKSFKVLLIAAAVAVFASCSSNTYKNINYLQDIQGDTLLTKAINTGIIIQPQDQLSIIVTCRDPKLATPFNLPVSTYYTGSELSVSGGASQRITGYIVDNNGDINFPILGTIHAAGLNRWELQELIRDMLSDTGNLKDAVVTVEYMNNKISILGEVTAPGTYNMVGDRMNILDALAMARDLTIYGRRDNILVVRTKDDGIHYYQLDLRDAGNLINSPGFYLQQSDIVYVTPNDVRAGQSTINENYFKSGSFWVSMGSLAITLTNLVITLSNNN
ncbi:MAG: polysaccharide biosynthesis/export family protein [Bacteroidales bacterium]|nr:polysaccharide biosynthesis/export family protein [Bacteroidales bacterium]